MIEILKSFISPTLLFFLVIIFYFFIDKAFEKQNKVKRKNSVFKQITLGLIIIIGILMVLLAMPISEEIKGQVLNAVGIIFSAAVALNSTTFLGNIFAGLMNKTINQFNVGDFVYVEKVLGKVSHIDLFHTEIQTEDRGLVSYSNIYIATNPIKVIKNSGTIISTEVSLGYDVSRIKIEKCLIEAAKKAKLKDPFVFITFLGDYSISYKINGLLEDITLILTSRSNLNAMVIDELHAAKIEIVSPTFMNQRLYPLDEPFIPKKSRIKLEKDTKINAEDIFFEKAFKAEKLEKKEDRLEDLELKISEMKVALKNLTDKDEKIIAKARIDKWETMLKRHKAKIEKEKTDLD